MCGVIFVFLGRAGAFGKNEDNFSLRGIVLLSVVSLAHALHRIWYRNDESHDDPNTAARCIFCSPFANPTSVSDIRLVAGSAIVVDTKLLSFSALD